MEILGYRCPHCKKNFETDDRVHERACKKESKEYDLIHAKYKKLKHKLYKDIFNDIINDPEVINSIKSIIQLKKDQDRLKTIIINKYGDWSKVDYENDPLLKEYFDLGDFYTIETPIWAKINFYIDKNVISLSIRSTKLYEHVLNHTRYNNRNIKDKVFKYFKIGKWLETT